ncbi:MAG: hypothetical protein KDA28_08560, partial [Phycisphaerales bacterium]|nr:hypothetical protein [Phycisphaerales bacterium]
MRIPVIIGPTAGGKTALAVDLALRLGGEVLSCDAFQIYRGMDIGSAKPTPDERRGVPHHGLDLVDPDETFTVHEWWRFATRTVEEIRSRGRLPILAGGTHLYVKAFMDGLFEGPDPDPAIRARFEAMDGASRRAMLESVDP